MKARHGSSRRIGRTPKSWRLQESLRQDPRQPSPWSMARLRCLWGVTKSRQLPEENKDVNQWPVDKLSPSCFLIPTGVHTCLPACRQPRPAQSVAAALGWWHGPKALGSGVVLPGAVTGSMLHVRSWQDKTTVDPQASREHASANGCGNMAPQSTESVGSMPPARTISQASRTRAGQALANLAVRD